MKSPVILPIVPLLSIAPPPAKAEVPVALLPMKSPVILPIVLPLPLYIAPP